MSRAPGIVVAAAVVLALAGCGSGATATDPPEGLEVRVYQTRTDLAERRLQVSVVNGTGADLTVTRLVFAAPQFADPMRWPKESTVIRSGVTADLPVTFAAPDCDASPGPASVELGYALADGREGTMIAVPGDVNSRLEAIRIEDCLAEAVDAIARIEAVTPPRHEVVDGRLVARYDLTIEPTGAPGSFALSGAIGNILVALVDGAGAPVGEVPLEVVVDGRDAPSVLSLSFVPGRCDEHAILEDKRGTLVGLRASADDGTAGIIWVTPAEPVRQAIYDFVREACAFTP